MDIGITIVADCGKTGDTSFSSFWKRHPRFGKSSRNSMKFRMLVEESEIHSR